MTSVSKIQIIKAHPQARRFVFSFICGALGFGWTSLFLSDRYSQHLLQTRTPFAAKLLSSLSYTLLLTAIVMGVGLLAFGLWMGYTAVQSLKEGCYPPAHSIVICDTVHVTGWRATVRALAAMMLAIASSLGAFGIGLEILGCLKL